MERFFGLTTKKRTTVPDNDIIAFACRRPRLSRMILSREIKKSEIADSSNSLNNLSSNLLLSKGNYTHRMSYYIK